MPRTIESFRSSTGWKRSTERTASSMRSPHIIPLGWLPLMLDLVFGSQFWPVLKPELVPWLLESLHENHIPFLFSHASPFAQLPQNFIEKIDAQEDSCIIKFAPQLAVLQHPATGCFVVSPSRFDP